MVGGWIVFARGVGGLSHDMGSTEQNHHLVHGWVDGWVHVYTYTYLTWLSILLFLDHDTRNRRADDVIDCMHSGKPW